jgi:uncharacterized protein (TIGR02145 family)
MKPLFKTSLITLSIAGSIFFLLISSYIIEIANPGSFTDARDGHIYKTVTIGNQIWMAENLAYLPKLNSLSEISESKTRYYVYNNDGTDVSIAKISENYKTYGVLYNWPAAMKACPKGWHLPCDKEWVILEKYLISNGFNFDNTITGNKIAKSLSASSGWESDESSAKGNICNDQSSNNRTLFSALPGGHYEGNGLFIGVGRECRFWSKKQLGSAHAWVRLLKNHNSNELDNVSSGLCKVENLIYYGISVRCLKD